MVDFELVFRASRLTIFMRRSVDTPRGSISSATVQSEEACFAQARMPGRSSQSRTTSPGGRPGGHSKVESPKSIDVTPEIRRGSFDKLVLTRIWYMTGAGMFSVVQRVSLGIARLIFSSSHLSIVSKNALRLSSPYSDRYLV